MIQKRQLEMSAEWRLCQEIAERLLDVWYGFRPPHRQHGCCRPSNFEVTARWRILLPSTLTTTDARGLLQVKIEFGCLH